MVLSEVNIKAFQQLYKARFGKDISEKEAYDKGVKLLRLMSLVYRPMTQAQFEAVQARQEELFKDQSH